MTSRGKLVAIFLIEAEKNLATKQFSPKLITIMSRRHSRLSVPGFHRQRSLSHSPNPQNRASQSSVRATPWVSLTNRSTSTLFLAGLVAATARNSRPKPEEPVVHVQTPSGSLIDPKVERLFRDVDSDQNGFISASELRRSLAIGKQSHFTEHACRMMIGRSVLILL